MAALSKRLVFLLCHFGYQQLCLDETPVATLHLGSNNSISINVCFSFCFTLQILRFQKRFFLLLFHRLKIAQ